MICHPKKKLIYEIDHSQTSKMRSLFMIILFSFVLHDFKIYVLRIYYAFISLYRPVLQVLSNSMMLYFLHHSLSFNNPTLPVSNLGIRRFVNIMLRVHCIIPTFSKKPFVEKSSNSPPTTTTTIPTYTADPRGRPNPTPR